MKAKPYPKTKPSGVEWLGDVPEHWEVKRLKTSATCWVSNVDKVPSDDELPVRLCNYTDVYYNDHITPEMGLMETTATADEIRRFGLDVGDVVITKDSEDWRDIAVPAVVKESAPDLVCGYHLAIVRARSEVLWGDFVLRAFQSSAVNQQFQVAASGVTRYGLPKASIGDAWIPLPPPTEQRSIAAYLDRETGRIDGLVAKKRELIERLKEKRAALISRTVTSGLPPAAAKAAGLPVNSPMKDSGIEWLEEIPEHWSAKKLGYGAWLQGGYAFASDKFDSEGVPVIRMNNLKRGVLDTSQASCVAPENCVDAFALAVGDLLWGMSGSIGETGSLGNFARVRQFDLPAQLNQRVGRFRIIGEQVSLDFLTCVIQTKFFYDQILLFVTGTAQFNVSSAQVQSVLMPFPPLPEQTAIAAYLDRETSKLDALVTKVEEAVERLQEYRSALITAAVTGKIDVRNEIKA